MSEQQATPEYFVMAYDKGEELPIFIRTFRDPYASVFNFGHCWIEHEELREKIRTLGVNNVAFPATEKIQEVYKTAVGKKQIRGLCPEEMADIWPEGLRSGIALSEA